MRQKEFTHLTNDGVHMVEVGNKPAIKRSATASGKIILNKETIDLVEKQTIRKGNVLTTAQIAAISAVKNTANIIPLCHPLSITGINVDFKVINTGIEVKVQVNSDGKTGVEMEAITGASVALLTIWDMVKSVEKDDDGQYPATRIKEIKVIEKIKDDLTY
jgi:cyclic pyranopterin phosphate synthase